MKGIMIGKEGIILSLFIDDIIIYIENMKELTPKLLELISDNTKVTGYTVNVQKAITAFLYAKNEYLKFEI